jgi:glycosyltransferase involved in cell wall biosynthesis
MMFDKAWPVGENRQAMVLASRADYISFIDDDDLVAPDYVNKIFPLLDGVDIVGFNVECFHDGSRLGTAYHSLEYGSWFRDGNKFYRDLSYMQPIRRELALRSRIEGGYGEDHRWAERLRALGCVKTEHRLNEVLYFYYYRSDKVVPA